jgi:hypothetical protein
MTLAGDLLLLAIDPERRRVRCAEKIDYALMGADLVELAIAGRASVEDGRISILSTLPTGDGQLDAALGSLRIDGKPPRAKTWVQRKRPGLRPGHLAQLADQGLIRIESRPVLKVFTRNEYSVLDIGRRTELVARVDAVAEGADPRDARDRALIGLAVACGLQFALFPGFRNNKKLRRLGEVGKHASQPTDEIVEATGAAVSTAISASTDAAVDAAVHAATHAAVSAAHSAGHGGGGHGGGGHGGH